MKQSIAARLSLLSNRLKQLNQILSSENATADLESYRRLTREHAEITPVVKLYGTYQSGERDLQAAQEMQSDPKMREFAEIEIREGREKLARIESELQKKLLPQDPNDERNIFLEIRAGTGGDESALFAGTLFRMYARFAERQRWQVEIISESPSDIGGYKEIIAKIIGKGAYSKLKFESGGHRVQRVPETEQQGRVHTSAITVAVLPEADEVEIVIDPKDIRIDTFCSSGPGGQSVNTTYSAVRITHLPTGAIVSCQDEKSQIKNRAKALRVLRSRLYELELEKQQEKIGAERRSMVGSGDRSETIRTYNFPQNRVTDHRIGLTLHQLDQVMDGKLEAIIEALTAYYQTEKLKEQGEAA